MNPPTSPREASSFRPVPWRNIIISAAIGAVLYGGVVYMYIRISAPPKQGGPSKAAVVASAGRSLEELVSAAKEQLQMAHDYATGPEGDRLRARIEETRAQIEDYSRKGADRAVENGKAIAAELRQTGKGELATNVEKSIAEWKEGAASLLKDGKETAPVKGGDAAKQATPAAAGK